MEKMPCSPYIMHRRYSVELCTEGVQSSHFTKVDCYDPIFDSWKDKNGYKPSKHGLCSRFLFRNDMCYIMIFLI